MSLYNAMHQQSHAKVNDGDQGGGGSSEDVASYRGRSVLSWTSKDE